MRGNSLRRPAEKGLREEILGSKDLADLFPAVEAAARKAKARRVILKVTTAEGNKVEINYDLRRDRLFQTSAKAADSSTGAPGGQSQDSGGVESPAKLGVRLPSPSPQLGPTLEEYEAFWKEREEGERHLRLVPGSCTRAMAHVGAQHFKGYQPICEETVRLLIEDVATAWEDMVSEGIKEACLARQHVPSITNPAPDAAAPAPMGASGTFTVSAKGRKDQR